MKLTRTQLTTAQSARKAELEAIIKQGLNQFMAVGSALEEVRDSKLYLDEHETFKDYLKVKWDISLSRGYQLMDAASTARNVSTIVEVPTEAAARPLTRLPAKDQVRAAKVLARSAAPVTARSVAQAVSTVRGGLAATLARPVEDEPEIVQSRCVNDAAAKVEAWYSEHRQRLNEYPAATPERVVQLILRLLRG